MPTKIVWTEAYNCYKTHVGKFPVNVNWRDGEYRISVCGELVKTNTSCRDIDHAKIAALAALRARCLKAIEIIDAEGDER